MKDRCYLVIFQSPILKLSIGRGGVTTRGTVPRFPRGIYICGGHCNGDYFLRRYKNLMEQEERTLSTDTGISLPIW